MLQWCWKSAAMLAALLGCILVGQGLAAIHLTEEDGSDEKKPSESLVHAVNMLLYQMDLGVRTKLYDQAAQEKIARQSATAAVLVMALAEESDPPPLGRAAEVFVPIAEQLAEAPQNQAAAAETITRLRKLAADPPEGEKMPARPVAKLHLLMQHIPEINNALRREMSADEPGRQRAAAQAALSLMAVASVSSHDLSYCDAPGEEIAWRTHCEELRMAANEIHDALAQQDRAAATKGLARLTKSCDSCHAEFRD